ncbi:hypothetical protein [Aneurinibacillus migulanus]|uniref:hypothetical protein n=1 Tax=Aneurinibacillus migulanus TaxID=47500 RepID=UPI001F41B12B|nr:hypothetical protein [Aneurinibacillus migulanus]
MIHRQILVVRGKKRRRGGSGQDTLAFLLLECRVHPTSSFSESPPSNHAPLSNYQV